MVALQGKDEVNNAKIAAWSVGFYGLVNLRKDNQMMKRVLITIAAVLAVFSLSGCGSIGKGKAPPPTEQPAAAPVYK
nr:hypothetical protein [Phyllobacterium endophyticum]